MSRKATGPSQEKCNQELVFRDHVAVRTNTRYLKLWIVMSRITQLVDALFFVSKVCSF